MMRASSDRRLQIALRDHGQRVDLLVLAIALVVVGLEVAHEPALDDGPGGIFGGNALGRGEGEAAETARLQRAHRGSGQLAQVGGRELAGFAAADEQQASWL